MVTIATPADSGTAYSAAPNEKTPSASTSARVTEAVEVAPRTAFSPAARVTENVSSPSPAAPSVSVWTVKLRCVTPSGNTSVPDAAT
jgi:hypothetical protein